VAEENVAKKTEEQVAEPVKKSQPLMLIGLTVVNIAAILAIGFFVYKSQMAEKNKPTPDDVIQAELEELKNGDVEAKTHLIPLETFLVNLSGTRGRKLVKVSMELEVSGKGSQGEIETLIRNQVNLFLSKGQIERVLFTQFIYN